MRDELKALVASALLFFLGAVLALGLKIDHEVWGFFPVGNKKVAEFLETRARFGDLDRIVFDISRPGSPHDPDVIRTAKAVSKGLLKLPSIQSVRGLVSPDEISNILNLFRGHRQNLFSARVASCVADRLDPGVFASRLAKRRREMTAFPDPLAVQQFTEDPLGVDACFLEILSTLSGVRGAQMIDGWIWSADREHLLLTAEPVSEGGRSTDFRKLVTEIEDVIAHSSQPGVRVAHMSGSRAAWDNEKTARRDVARTLPIATVGVIGLLFLVFRSWRAVIVLFTPVLFAGVWSIAALRLAFGNVSAVVLGSGSIVIGIAIDYGLHVAGRRNLADKNVLSDRNWTQQIRKPLIVAAATTSVAFLSLLASDVPGQRQLAILGAAGIIGAVLFSLVLLPSFLPPPIPSSSRGRRLARCAGFAFRFLRRHRPQVVALLTVISVALGVGVWRVSVDGDLLSFNALLPETSADMRLIRRVWGSLTDQVSIVVHGNRAEDALRKAESVATVLEEEQESDRLVSYQSITGLVPSHRQQLENSARWKTFWDGEQIQELRTWALPLLRNQGFTVLPLQRFVNSLSQPESFLSLEEIRQSAATRLVESSLRQADTGETWILSRATLSPGVALGALRDRIRRAVTGSLVTSGSHVAGWLSGMVVTETGRVGSIGLLLVMISLFPVFRGRRQIFAIVLVLGLTLLWSLGLLGWLSVSISIMNCTLGVLVLGLTIDYTVFLMHATMEPSQNHGAVLLTVLLSAATTLIGFGVLLMARHPALHVVGVTTVVGVSCGLAGSVLVVSVLFPPESHQNDSSRGTSARDDAPAN